jgi:hypothetical protein
VCSALQYEVLALLSATIVQHKLEKLRSTKKFHSDEDLSHDLLGSDFI